MKKILLTLLVSIFLIPLVQADWIDVNDWLNEEILSWAHWFAKDSKWNLYLWIANVEWNWLYRFDFESGKWERIIHSPTYWSTRKPEIIMWSDWNEYLFSRSHILNLSDIESGWYRPEIVPDKIVNKYDPEEFREAKRLQSHLYMQFVRAWEWRFLVVTRKWNNPIVLTYDPVTKEWEDLNFLFRYLDGKPHITLTEIDWVIFYKTNYSWLFAYQNWEWNRITHNRRVFRWEVAAEHSAMWFWWNWNPDDREIYYSYTPINATQITSDRLLKMNWYTFSDKTAWVWEVRDTWWRFPVHVLVDSSWIEYHKWSWYAFPCRPLLDIAYCGWWRFGWYFKLENWVSKMPDHSVWLWVNLWDRHLWVRDSIAVWNDLYFIVMHNWNKTIRKMTFDKEVHGRIATDFKTSFSSYLDMSFPKWWSILENWNILVWGYFWEESKVVVYSSDYAKLKEINLEWDLVHIESSRNNKYTWVLTTEKLYLFEWDDIVWSLDVSEKWIVVNNYNNDKQQKNRISVWEDWKIALLYDKNIAVVQNSQIIFEEHFWKTYANDIAIDTDKNNVYVTWYQQFNNLQVAVIFAYRIWQKWVLWSTWNFNRPELSESQNMADTRWYRITLWHNWDLYFAWESAWWNTIFRWNWQDLSTRTVNEWDMYNASWWISWAAHLWYLWRINTDNWEVIQGQIIVPRLFDWNGNTFRSKHWEINIDRNWNVIFMATSACCGPNRNFLSINWEALWAYSWWDNVLYVTDETLNNRILWTSLSANRDWLEQWRSHARGVLIWENDFYVLNEITWGEVFTTNNSLYERKDIPNQAQLINVDINMNKGPVSVEDSELKEDIIEKIENGIRVKRWNLEDYGDFVIKCNEWYIEQDEKCVRESMPSRWGWWGGWWGFIITNQITSDDTNINNDLDYINSSSISFRNQNVRIVYERFNSVVDMIIDFDKLEEMSHEDNLIKEDLENYKEVLRRTFVLLDDFVSNRSRENRLKAQYAVRVLSNQVNMLLKH